MHGDHTEPARYAALTSDIALLSERAELWRYRWALRHGRVTEIPPQKVNSSPYHAGNQDLAWADYRLLFAPPEEAISRTRDAIERCHEAGLTPKELLLRVALCQALATHGTLDELEREAQTLLRRSQEHGTQRFAAMAEFFLSQRGEGKHLARLEVLANSYDSSPEAARWSRAYFGSQVPLDLIEQAMLRGLGDKHEYTVHRLEFGEAGDGGTWLPG